MNDRCTLKAAEEVAFGPASGVGREAPLAVLNGSRFDKLPGPTAPRGALRLLRLPGNPVNSVLWSLATGCGFFRHLNLSGGRCGYDFRQYRANSLESGSFGG